MIKKIAVSGAGTMGAGIAQIFARNDYKVLLSDINQEALDKGHHLIEVFNKTLIEEKLMDEKENDKIFENIEFVVGIDRFDEVDLIIEAIIEVIDIKKSYWKEVEKIAKKDAIFATNTSGLKINDISSDLEDKTRFIGSHFFNPGHLIPLVELIKGNETSDEVVDTMVKLMEDINKVPVVVQKDAAGFIANRLQFAVVREAMNIVEKGIAEAKDVDNAMKYGPGFRYPIIGPLETADFGGLDVFEDIMSYLFLDLADNKEVNDIIKNLNKEGKHGIKSKAGFYDYPGDKADEAIENRDKKLFKMIKYIYQDNE